MRPSTAGSPIATLCVQLATGALRFLRIPEKTPLLTEEEMKSVINLGADLGAVTSGAQHAVVTSHELVGAVSERVAQHPWAEAPPAPSARSIPRVRFRRDR